MAEARQVAVVTGASRGLGAALAQALATRGARVAMVARDAGVLHAAASRIRAGGGEVLAIADDVADPAAAVRIAAQVHAAFGTPTIVVHNASTLGAVPLPLLADTPAAVFTTTLATNLVGPFALTQALVGAMILAGRGVIVHVSSDAAVEAYPGWGAYGVSKAGLDHLARAWAAELDGTGLRVFAVDPGEMATQMHADAIPEADPATLADPRDVAERIAAMIADAALAPTGSRVRAAAIEVAA